MMGAAFAHNQDPSRHPRSHSLGLSMEVSRMGATPHNNNDLENHGRGEASELRQDSVGYEVNEGKMFA
jgi:hypothetical protein